MIYLTNRTGEKERFVYNCDLIAKIKEGINGTMINTTDGSLLIVEETPQEIIREIQNYRADILLLLEKKKEEGASS